ncbi:hypothetical protein [Lactobacillus sp. ESL0225]|uniref:hypothetical protein n=1 Tax=Lactobacillus sp. ESL0225 TaxID=2069351 RepID=UPI000EFA634A|nr:hypothetical protein [Lactobacillus sp. ESL0225]RMC50785.1 hypothetical protein F5ESL0225_04110 [Lactobacillus sp. ESL0225]
MVSRGAFINEYLLLFFDTFTFQVKNNKDGVSFDKNITILYDNENLEVLGTDVDDKSSEENVEQLKKVESAWKQSRISNKFKTREIK